MMLGSTQDLCKWAVSPAPGLASAPVSMQMWSPHQQAVELPLHLYWVLWFVQQSAPFWPVFHVPSILTHSGHSSPLIDLTFPVMADGLAVGSGAQAETSPLSWCPHLPGLAPG